MKVDKEYLIKHHFWILLGTFTPLLLVALILLWTSVASAIDEKAKAIDQLKGEVKGVDQRDVKNTKWIGAAQNMADELAQQKQKVWKEVWDEQATVFSWPDLLRKSYPNVTTLDYGDPLTPVQLRLDYVVQPECYRKQLGDLVAIVQPVDPKTAEGTVQFKGGWKEVIRHVSKWIGGEAQTTPSSEEMWLAQEDYWVQRELLQCIRNANDVVGVYHKVSGAATPKKDEVDRQVFESPVWRLELAVARNQFRWRITNRSPRQQALKMKILVTFQPRRTQEVWLDGEPLAPNQTSPEVAEKFEGFLGLKGIDAVEQLLDWQTAPVKRIDKIALGQQAHSNAAQKLVPFKGFVVEKKEDDSSSEKKGMTVPTGMPTGAAARNPAANRDSSGISELGLERNRYLESNDQVRRMPVGMVLIVDQNNTQDILAAFADSRLRFQVTQVEWRRYYGSVKPAPGEENKGGGGGDTVPSERRRDPTSGMIGQRRTTTTTTAQDDSGNKADTSNLIEMAVYGVASLYQRFPPKGAEGAAAAQATETGADKKAPRRSGRSGRRRR